MQLAREWRQRPLLPLFLCSRASLTNFHSSSLIYLIAETEKQCMPRINKASLETHGWLKYSALLCFARHRMVFVGALRQPIDAFDEFKRQ